VLVFCISYSVIAMKSKQLTFRLDVYIDSSSGTLEFEDEGLESNCRVHKPRVPNGPTSQQKLGPADDITNDAQLLGQPRYLTTGRKSDLVSDRKAWPMRGRRSLLTVARFPDRKA